MKRFCLPLLVSMGLLGGLARAQDPSFLDPESAFGHNSGLGPGLDPGFDGGLGGPMASPLPDQMAMPGGGPGGVSAGVGGSRGVDISANLAWYHEERGAILMSEGVRASYMGTTITADRCDYDSEAEVAYFYPYIVLEREGERIVGERCVFSLRDRTWTIWNATAELSPKFFSNWTTDFSYIHAERIDGDDNRADLTKLYFTTCPKARVERTTDTGIAPEPEIPHWRIEADHGKIDRRGEYVSVGPSKVYLGRQAVFWLPGWGVERSWLSKLDTLPEIGQNASEGMYFGWAYRYSARNFVKVRFTEKQGNTYGADWSYRGDDDRFRFDINANYRTKTDSFTGASTLNAPLLGGHLSASYSLSRTSALIATTSTTENRRIGYTNSGDRFQLRLNANQTITTSTQRRENMSADASIRYSFGDKDSLDASTRYTSTDTILPGGDGNELVANEELLTTIVYQSRQKAVDWEARVEMRDDPDGDTYTGDDSFGYVERLPQVTARTNLRRLGVNSRAWTTSMEATAGWIREAATDTETARYALDLSANRRALTWGDTAMTLSSNYRQRWYGDGTAIYSVGGRVGLESDWSSHWASSVTYNVVDTSGYSPFRFDYMTNTHNISAAVNWTNRRTGSNQRSQLSTAYDFRLRRWSDLRWTYAWNGSAGNSLSLNANYRLESGEMGLVSLRYNRRRYGCYDWSLSAGYDFRTSKLQTIRSSLDWEIERDQWRLRWGAGYNPARGKLDQNNIQLIRYTHCFTYALTYNAQRQGFRFSVNVRGLPSLLDDGFSVGGTGEFLSPTTGGSGDVF